MSQTDKITSILHPYRQKIDTLDKEIIDLLKQRYDIINQVSHIKAQEKIDAALPDRIDEVRENAARYAASLNLDEAFFRSLWAQIIDHAIQIEEQEINAQHTQKK